MNQQTNPTQEKQIQLANAMKLIAPLTVSPAQKADGQCNRQSEQVPYTLQTLQTAILKYSSSEKTSEAQVSKINTNLSCHQKHRQSEGKPSTGQSDKRSSRSSRPCWNEQKQRERWRQLDITQYPAEDYIKYIAPLFGGVLTMKFCYNTIKLRATVLSISEDLQYMSLYSIVDEDMKVFSLKDWRDTHLGTKTKKFKQYIDNKRFKVQEHLCFSVQFKDRTFDFEADTKADRTETVKRLTVLFSMINRR